MMTTWGLLRVMTNWGLLLFVFRESWMRAWEGCLNKMRTPSGPRKSSLVRVLSFHEGPRFFEAHRVTWREKSLGGTHAKWCEDNLQDLSSRSFLRGPAFAKVSWHSGNWTRKTPSCLCRCRALRRQYQRAFLRSTCNL